MLITVGPVSVRPAVGVVAPPTLTSALPLNPLPDRKSYAIAQSGDNPSVALLLTVIMPSRAASWCSRPARRR